MGRIIHQNNGKTTVYVTGEDLNLLTGNTNTYFLGIVSITGSFNKRNPDGGVEAIGGGVVSTTYSELVSNILSSGLTVGSFYLITDFKTCYDQPDFDYGNNPITTGNYKQGPVEPLIVLATSNSTISKEAYQSTYPNDKITYDWSFSATEVTNSVAFGRITERIDEFNNRTDYDHRNILFKRYKLFTHREGQPLNGTIEITSTNLNNVTGTTTQFTNLSVGDVIYVPGINPSYYEVIHISGDTLMSITGDTLSSFGSGLEFYKCIEETNGSGYFSHKRTNVKLNDFVEYTTFGDAIANNYAKNNYIGNYANNYQNVGAGNFLLANNVFLEGEYESNKFGDYCYNNTFGTDNQNNIWGDYCYENVSTNDIDANVIGHNFYRNLLNVNLINNQIGNYFHNNQLLAENNESFEDNIIGNNFNNNIIYSWFYKNEILDNFNENTIGDFGNLDNFEFYRNYIRNGFNNNTIRQDFQNNQIGTNYQSNEINGEFINNTILNGFNNNTIGYWFWGNTIGNGFNDNRINDDFYSNTIGFNFRNNLISNEFDYNHIGTEFNNNRPSNSNLFGWSNLFDLSGRTYSNFNNIVGGGQLGNKILGKELIMHIPSTSQYFKIIFNQWSQGGNGGGFQYVRQEVDLNGNNLGPIVTFTKMNNGSEVDVIIPDVVEITRGNNNGIYNIAKEGSWNSSVSPSGTTWNSIYNEPYNGRNFAYNKIGNNFYNNTIGNDFGYGGSQAQGNVINDNFENNVIGEYMYSNIIGNYFQNNTIGDDFEGNSIRNYFANNTIGDDFYNNTINNNFSNNSIGSLFRYNIVKAPNLSNTDFTSASIVYSAYTSEIFTNSLGNYKLSYYDGTDTLIITNVNS